MPERVIYMTLDLRVSMMLLLLHSWAVHHLRCGHSVLSSAIRYKYRLEYSVSVCCLVCAGATESDWSESSTTYASTPESYSQFQIEPTLLRRNLPTQPPVQPLQQQQSAATAEGIYRRYFCYGWLGSRVVSVLDSGAQGHSRDAVR